MAGALGAQAGTVVGYVAAAAASGLPTDWPRLAAEVGLTEELATAIRAGARSGRPAGACRAASGACHHVAAPLGAACPACFGHGMCASRAWHARQAI
jgi:hypothetical protein